MKYFPTIILTALLSVCGLMANGQDYRTDTDIQYRSSPQDDYQRERCVLDVYYPENTDGFATIVWFHGGGLTGGNKKVPELLKGKGMCVVAANYRFSGKVQAPAYIEDAAAAVAWTVENIADYGGNPSKIYVSGHSAGGYLASMVGLDKQYLAEYGIDPDDLAGWFPISGQTVTHSQVMREQGLEWRIPMTGEYAPISHIRSDTPPWFFFAGEQDMEMNFRTAENRLMAEAMKHIGNKNVRFYELEGFDHNRVVEPSILLMLEAIRKLE